MSSPCSATIIVCAHSGERLPLLRQALLSVINQQGGPHEIIAVIDHNPELLAEVAGEFAGVKVIHNGRQRGLSGARNSGIDAATGDVVAFLDDDAVAPSDWVERLLAHYVDLGVMAVGGRIDAVWPNGRPRWFPREFDWVVGCSYLGLPEAVTPVRNLIGCNMSFRRTIFSIIGSFREGQGRDGDNAAGCEETDLCIRAGSAFPGSAIVYDPSIAVQHVLSEQRCNWQYYWRRCVAEGQSKAMLTRALGSRSGLAAERRYVRQVLPNGVWAGLLDGLRLDTTGLARAAAILAGFSGVALGYIGGRIRRSGDLSAPEDLPFAPIRVVEVDLDAPPEVISARDDEAGILYGGAFCAVRSGGQLVRIAEVPLYGEDLAFDRVSGLLTVDGQGTAEPIFAAATVPGDLLVRVIVATRDRPEQLAKCIDSLLAQDHRNFEIVVVDNCPSDNSTRDLIEKRYGQLDNVQYRRENRAGLGHAHNAGLVGNGASVIAFTDDDVRTDRGWLTAIVRNFVASDRVGCVTGMILPAELETRAQYWTERHGGFGKGLQRRVFDLNEHRIPSPLFPFAAGSFGSGANMAFSRKALESVGGFDGALGAGTLAKGGDDLAAFVSVIQAGYQIVYEPQAILWHLHRRNVQGMERQAYGYGVGLGAYLTKFLVERPGTIWHYAKAFPAGVLHLVSNGSSKNAKLPVDYPPGLRWSERLGVVAGFPAYFRSRASFRTYLREQGYQGPEGS